MNCRRGCAACCIAPSISGPLPGMPDGKPAGIACVNLDPETLDCRIWQQADYPDVCRRFSAEAALCGDERSEALQLIARLEDLTS